MPIVQVSGQADMDLSMLGPIGVPIGTYVRTQDGHFYRLAQSTATLSAVVPQAAPASVSAIAPKRAASAINSFGTTFSQPDQARQLTATTDGTGWDGGDVRFYGPVGSLQGPLVEEFVTPPQVAGTVTTVNYFAALRDPPSKAIVGAVATTVSLGWADAFPAAAIPLVVAVRGSDGLRWLYADAEVAATVLPLLSTWNPSTGRMALGLLTNLQDLIDSRNSIFRMLMDDLRASGVTFSDTANSFYDNSQR